MTIPEAEKIASDYGGVIADNSPYGGLHFHVKHLPHSIDDIKQALVICYHYAGFDEKRRTACGSCYVMLADFYEDDELAKARGKVKVRF